MDSVGSNTFFSVGVGSYTDVWFFGVGIKVCLRDVFFFGWRRGESGMLFFKIKELILFGDGSRFYGLSTIFNMSIMFAFQ